MWFRRLILVAGAVAATACGGDGDGGNGPGGGDGDPDDQVTVRNNNFSPSALNAAPGGAITWIWAAGSSDHNVTFDDGPASPTQSSGTFSRTFAAAGSYPYHCTIHGPAMNGAITVAASAPGSGGGGGGGGYDY